MDNHSSAEKHVTLLGVFHIVYHTLAFFIGLGIIVLFSYLGALTQDPQANAVLTMLGGFIGTVLIVVAIPGIIGGVGLLKRQSWARMLAMIVGAIDLLDIPIGTALVVYTLWALMRDDVVVFLQK